MFVKSTILYRIIDYKNVCVVSRDINAIKKDQSVEHLDLLKVIIIIVVLVHHNRQQTDSVRLLLLLF